MNVLVTGGAGYIGSHTVYELIRQNHQVIVVDNLSTGNREAVHPQAIWYEGDQSDSQLLNAIFQNHQIDVVIHCSAKLIVPESVKEPIKYFENNVHGLAILLEQMRQNNVKNIVFSSTAAVYGEPTRLPIQEDDPKNPLSPYGQSKLACEWLIQGASQAFDFNYVIFRYFNVAGADRSGAIGQSTKGHKITHLIPVMLQAALTQKKPFLLYGNDYSTPDGTCIRDYIHVSDLALAHIKGAEYVLAQKSNVFNLGSQHGFSVQEVLKTAEETLKVKIPLALKKRRPGDPAQLVADITKAQNILGFKPRHSLAEMIISDWHWRQNTKF